MKENFPASEDPPLFGWIALIISLAIYVILFFIAEEVIGTNILVLAFLPVILGSWYLGVRGGILSATLVVFVSMLLFELKDYQNSWDVLIHGELSLTVSFYIVAIAIGYLGHKERQYKEAFHARVQVSKSFEAQVSSLTSLINITNDVLDATDFTSTLLVLAEQTREVFKANDCLISLWDAREEEYYPRAAAGEEKEALENLPPQAENAILARLQSADILIYGNLEELGDIGRPFLTIHPQGTLLALPLIASGEKIGLLQLLYEYAHQFTPHELTYAKLTSRQISQAILKVILLSQAEDQVEELRALHEVAVVIPQSSDEAGLLENVIKVLDSSLYSANLSMILLDEKWQVLEHTSTYQVNNFKLGQGITGSVAQTGVLERYDDVREAPNYVNTLSSTLSEICVPIKDGKRVLGLINVESDDFAAFDIRDERILTTVANQIAVGLTRLRAEQAQSERVLEIAHSNELIRALTEVASQMVMSSEPETVMRQMGAALKPLGLKILIALSEPEAQELLIRYTSLDAEIIKEVAGTVGKDSSVMDLRISADSLPAHINLTESLHPVILDDFIGVISHLLQSFPDGVLQRVLDRMMDREKITVGHFPLVYREKVLGFLWLWGESLAENDLPALSVFANQVAATLEYTRLFGDVQRLAVTDGLTQLYTRRHFFELAYEEFYRARRYGRPLSILMLDLDHFKQVNDTYGHSAGDLVLEQTAATCKKMMRTNDVIGRYGGEEIIILLIETNLDDAYTVGLRILEKIRQLRIATKKGEVSVTISGGVAGDSVEDMNLIEMIESADRAMYAAKNAGRDRIETAPRIVSQDQD